MGKPCSSMLSYVSSTRKKSCNACVKSKRRCDLGYPCCKRCFTKGLDCAYPNASGKAAEEVVVRLSTPEILALENEADNRSCEHPRIEPIIDPSLVVSSDSSSPESVQDELPQNWLRQAQIRESPMQMPHIQEPVFLNDEQVLVSINRLCSFIPQIAYSGSTPFIHAAQYSIHQPAAYQDSCSLSALYLVRTPQTKLILAKSIDSKINSLIVASKTWSLCEHLAAVQALIIYQIIRLFDADLGLQQIAEKHNILLEVWSAHLWKRYFNERQNFPPCFDSWAFEESLRRTVLLSVFLRGIWHCLKTGGYCDQVPILARLPMTRDFGLWASDAEEWTRRKEHIEEPKRLMAYLEFSQTWESGSNTNHLTEWEKLLLVACRGSEDPSLLAI